MAWDFVTDDEAAPVRNEPPAEAELGTVSASLKSMRRCCLLHFVVEMASGQLEATIGHALDCM